MQCAAPMPNAVVAAVVAWMLSIDVHARALLREAETRTAGLVFTAPDAERRLTITRLASTVLLSVFAVAPLLLRSLVTSIGMIGPVLLVAAAVGAFGLACSVVFRSPRPYELTMVALAYVGVQGSGPLAVGALSPSMGGGVAIVLTASLALIFANTSRLAMASARTEA
ncbi:MAG: hypothetical protein ABIP11_07120 [Luteimonas sp.]